MCRSDFQYEYIINVIIPFLDTKTTQVVKILPDGSQRSAYPEMTVDVLVMQDVRA